MADVNGDGFITQEDRARGYDVYCGEDEDGNDIVKSLIPKLIFKLLIQVILSGSPEPPHHFHSFVK